MTKYLSKKSCIGKIIISIYLIVTLPVFSQSTKQKNDFVAEAFVQVINENMSGAVVDSLKNAGGEIFIKEIVTRVIVPKISENTMAKLWNNPNTLKIVLKKVIVKYAKESEGLMTIKGVKGLAGGVLLDIVSDLAIEAIPEMMVFSDSPSDQILKGMYKESIRQSTIIAKMAYHSKGNPALATFTFTTEQLKVFYEIGNEGTQVILEGLDDKKKRKEYLAEKKENLLLLIEEFKQFQLSSDWSSLSEKKRKSIAKKWVNFVNQIISFEEISAIGWGGKDKSINDAISELLQGSSKGNPNSISSILLAHTGRKSALDLFSTTTKDFKSFEDNSKYGPWLNTEDGKKVDPTITFPFSNPATQQNQDTINEDLTNQVNNTTNPSVIPPVTPPVDTPDEPSTPPVIVNPPVTPPIVDIGFPAFQDSDDSLTYVNGVDALGYNLLSYNRQDHLSVIRNARASQLGSYDDLKWGTWNGSITDNGGNGINMETNVADAYWLQGNLTSAMSNRIEPSGTAVYSYEGALFGSAQTTNSPTIREMSGDVSLDIDFRDNTVTTGIDNLRIQGLSAVNGIQLLGRAGSLSQGSDGSFLATGSADIDSFSNAQLSFFGSFYGMDYDSIGGSFEINHANIHADGIITADSTVRVEEIDPPVEPPVVEVIVDDPGRLYPTLRDGVSFTGMLPTLNDQGQIFEVKGRNVTTNNIMTWGRWTGENNPNHSGYWARTSGNSLGIYNQLTVGSRRLYPFTPNQGTATYAGAVHGDYKYINPNINNAVQRATPIQGAIAGDWNLTLDFSTFSGDLTMSNLVDASTNEAFEIPMIVWDTQNRTAKNWSNQSTYSDLQGSINGNVQRGDYEFYAGTWNAQVSRNDDDNPAFAIADYPTLSITGLVEGQKTSESGVSRPINDISLAASQGNGYLITPRADRLLGESGSQSALVNIGSGGLPSSGYNLGSAVETGSNSYNSWGTWNSTPTTPERPLKYWIQGQMTPANRIPTTGTATYSSSVSGTYANQSVNGFNNTISGTVTGNVALKADFDQRRIYGQFNNLEGGSISSTVDLSGVLHEGASTYDGAVQGANGSGQFFGAFFGPNYEAIGGVWNYGNSTHSYNGIFQGTR